MKKRTFRLVLTGLVAAFLCLASPFMIPLPFSPVPVTLATLTIYLSVYIAGTKTAAAGTCVYILLGALGMPVFSGFCGGIGKLFGPTGGYIFGYIPIVLISGFFIEKFEKKRKLHLVGMALGTLSSYFIGTLWFVFSQKTSAVSAFMLCVLPYLFADGVKIWAAAVMGPVVKKRVQKQIFSKNAF